MYIIKLHNEKAGVDHYVRKGEYSYWELTHRDVEAFRFESEEAASEALKHFEFHKPNQMASGNVYPPVILHSAAGLNNQVESGSVIVSIVKISFTETAKVRWEYEMDFSGVLESKID